MLRHLANTQELTQVVVPAARIEKGQSAQREEELDRTPWSGPGKERSPLKGTGIDQYRDQGQDGEQVVEDPVIAVTVSVSLFETRNHGLGYHQAVQGTPEGPEKGEKNIFQIPDSKFQIIVP
jgi:hypothetical protein